MSRRLPELPAEAVAEYWQLVRAALTANGMSKAEAAAAAKAFREFMKPAGWTIYNRDPEDSARLAMKHAAWMRKEAERAATKSKVTPKRASKPPKIADTLPTEEEIAGLPCWARVAFAARCARRVLPCFMIASHSLTESESALVEATVDVGEICASRALRDEEHARALAVKCAVVAARLTHPVVVDAGVAIIRAAKAVYTETVNVDKTAHAMRHRANSRVKRDFITLSAHGLQQRWTDATPVPPAVFGPLWPEGPPAGWPALPKPAKLRLTVEVPDGLDDAAVQEKLQKLTTALARLNVAGGGHGLKLLPPIDFTQEQDKGRADVVREESEKPNGRGNARRGR